MTDSPDFSGIVGRPVETVRPNTIYGNNSQDLVVGHGFEMTTDGGTLKAWVDSDEFYVEVRPSS